MSVNRKRGLIPAILLILGCAGAHSPRRGDRVVVSSYPQEIQQAYPVFAVRCSRCHTLARPLNAHITDPQHWVRYVTRMRRQPTSGINREDAEIILRFLLYYAHEEQLRQAGKTDQETAPRPTVPARMQETPKAAKPALPPPEPPAPEPPEPPEPPPGVDRPSTPANVPDGREP